MCLPRLPLLVDEVEDAVVLPNVFVDAVLLEEPLLPPLKLSVETCSPVSAIVLAISSSSTPFLLLLMALPPLLGERVRDVVGEKVVLPERGALLVEAWRGTGASAMLLPVAVAVLPL